MLHHTALLLIICGIADVAFTKHSSLSTVQGELPFQDLVLGRSVDLRIGHVSHDAHMLAGLAVIRVVLPKVEEICPIELDLKDVLGVLLWTSEEVPARPIFVVELEMGVLVWHAFRIGRFGTPLRAFCALAQIATHIIEASIIIEDPPLEMSTICIHDDRLFLGESSIGKVICADRESPECEILKVH